jgi:rhamnose transport system permease protein
MEKQNTALKAIWSRLIGWEGFLLLILIVVLIFNSIIAINFLTVGNQINLFILSIEKIIVVITMAFIIISAEIDLSAPSIMGLSAVVMASAFERGLPLWVGIILGLIAGLLCGLFNGFWIAKVGINSLIVTLAMLIGYRGLARFIIEDNYIGNFPQWFNDLGQQPLVGPIPFALILWAVFFIIAVIILHFSGFGRRVFVTGANIDVARFSGIKTTQVKLILFTASGAVSAIAGMLLASRVSSVRGDLALGFELDIITMVLLGGVSIFGGRGTYFGVFISILLVLNIRNGLGLLALSEHIQRAVIAALLILSVLGPNIVSRIAEWNRRRKWKINGDLP